MVLEFLQLFGLNWPEWLLITIFYVLLVWSGIWKGIALWFSGKNRQKVWFIVIFILNTLGILPIIYIFAFRKNRKKKPKSSK